MRGFVCVISVRGLSSSYAWSCGSLGIFATFLGFAKCLYKPLFILQVIFIAWRPFYSLEIILQLKGKNKHKKEDRIPFFNLGNCFRNGGSILQRRGFLQPISQLRNGHMALRSGTCVPKGGFAAAKHPSKWLIGCEIPAQLCAFVFKRP